MSIVGWFVIHGPDRSHLFNAELFNRKRDAMSRYQALPDGTPAKVLRHEWRNAWLTDMECDVKLVTQSF